jgi:hypothetical protein
MDLKLVQVVIKLYGFSKNLARKNYNGCILAARLSRPDGQRHAEDQNCKKNGCQDWQVSDKRPEQAKRAGKRQPKRQRLPSKAVTFAG